MFVSFNLIYIESNDDSAINANPNRSFDLLGLNHTFAQLTQSCVYEHGGNHLLPMKRKSIDNSTRARSMTFDLRFFS